MQHNQSENQLILKSLHLLLYVKGKRKKSSNNKGHFIRLRSSNSQITTYIPWDMRQLLPNRHRCCRKNLHICTTGRFVLVSLFIIMAHILRALYSCYPEENYGRLKGSCSCNAPPTCDFLLVPFLLLI
jgi:hypothetical protein